MPAVKRLKVCMEKLEQELRPKKGFADIFGKQAPKGSQAEYLAMGHLLIAPNL